MNIFCCVKDIRVLGSTSWCERAIVEEDAGPDRFGGWGASTDCVVG